MLLEEQDRELWDQQTIAIGLQWLAKSAQGHVYSRFHAEAGIAAAHCLAPSFAQTRWDQVAQGYALLETVAPSPLHRLNRAVALAQWQGPAVSLAVLAGFEPPTWLAGSYLWAAVQADLHRRLAHSEQAERYSILAIASAPSLAIAQLLRRRLQPTGL